jgi:hypothetical protein
MTARTVLATTQTSVTAYSTSSLAVGDLTEFALDLLVTAATGGTLDASGYYTYGFFLYRIDVNGNLCLLIESPTTQYCDWGAGSPATGLTSRSYGVAANNWSFGDHIKFVMSNPNGITVDFQLSIIGK